MSHKNRAGTEVKIRAQFFCSGRSWWAHTSKLCVIDTVLIYWKNLSPKKNIFSTLPPPPENILVPYLKRVMGGGRWSTHASIVHTITWASFARPSQRKDAHDSPTRRAARIFRARIVPFTVRGCASNCCFFPLFFLPSFFCLPRHRSKSPLTFFHLFVFSFPFHSLTPFLVFFSHTSLCFET
jgi:hypothetical protein